MIIEKNDKKYEIKGDGFGMSMDWVYYPAQKVLLMAPDFNSWYDTEKSDLSDECPEEVRKNIMDKMIIFDMNDKDESFKGINSLSQSMFRCGVDYIRNEMKRLLGIQQS